MHNSADRFGKRNLVVVSTFFILILFFIFSSNVHAVQQGETNPGIVFEASLQQGMQAYNTGNFEQAILQWRAAIQQLQAEADEQGLANTHLYLAGALQELGRFGEAIDSLNQALDQAQKLGDQDMQTRIMASLGQVYILTGNEEEAVRYITGSADRTKKDADPALRAAVLNNLGNLFESQKKYDQAGIVYRDVAALAKQANNQELAAKAKVNLARVSLEQEDFNRAVKELKGALPLAAALPDSHEKATILIQAGQLFSRIHKSMKRSGTQNGDAMGQAYKSLTQAQKVADRINDSRAGSYALGYLGGLYEMERRYDEALAFTRQAVFAAQKIQAPDILYLWQWQTGRILKAQGNINGAIAAHKRSLQNLDAVKKDLAEECHSNIRNRNSYIQTVGPIYFGLADLLLQRSAGEQDLLLARDTIERLKTVEIQDYFQDDCVTAYLSRSLSLEQLAVNTAIVYPIVLPNRVEILLSFKDEIKQFTVPVDGRKLIQEVRLLREQIEVPGSRYLEYATKLYNWLVRPIEEDLARQKIELMVFVLDRSLRSIPMSVLHDGKNFLIQKYGIATTLGLTLTAPQPLGKDNVQVLLNGLSEGVQGFPPLPSVSAELQSINDKFEGQLFQNKDFTKANIKEALLQQSYSIIHIASHAQFDSDPQNTFLLTYDSKLTMDELNEFLEPSRFREEPVELLTMSACQTAIGDERAALGLAGVAVKAGARSALASLWYVDDEATARLMEGFYGNLSRFTGSKAQALQQAQLALLDNQKFQHPAFWAPFILIGNWL
jgi:CHAT domain-containing protein/Tfp pilus assembly protein PilF